MPSQVQVHLEYWYVLPLPESICNAQVAAAVTPTFVLLASFPINKPSISLSVLGDVNFISFAVLPELAIITKLYVRPAAAAVNVIIMCLLVVAI